MSEPDTTLPTTPPHSAGPDLSRLDQHLGDVMVEAEIARTALAAVYRVRTGAHGDTPLALKVALHPCDAEELARFRHEVRLLTEARHPNVVEVYDCGALPGGCPRAASASCWRRRTDRRRPTGSGCTTSPSRPPPASPTSTSRA
jgi:hypothetical protein